MKLIKLNAFGSLGLTIPKAIVESTGLKPGDDIQIEIKQADPLILALKKSEPIMTKKW